MSSIRLKHASGNSMSLAAPGTNPASNLELKLPHTIGSANQLLKVDANGQLGWADDNSGLSLSNDANNRVVTGTGSGLNAEANLTFTGSILHLTGDLAVSTANRIYFGNSDVAWVKGEHGGSGYLQFGVNTEHMRLLRSGYLGLGVTNPTAKLEIHNGSNIEVLRIKDTHFNKYLTIRGGGSPNRMVIDSYEGGGGGADIDFASNGSTKVRIKSSGVTEFGSNGNYGANPRTVSIGSRTQNIFAPLAIARGEVIGGGTGPLMEFIHGPDSGTQRIHQLYSYVGDFRIFADANENMELRGANIIMKDGNSNEKVRVNSNGIIGVNIASPTVGYGGDTGIHIHSSATSGTRGPTIHLTSGVSGTAASDGSKIHQSDTDLVIQNHENGGLFLGSGNAHRLTITSGGRCGIGTTSPSSQIHSYTSGSDGLLIQTQSFTSYVWQIESSGNLFNGSLAGELGIRGESGIGFSPNGGSSMQFRIASNGRIRTPTTYSTNGSSMRDVQVESDGTLCAGNTSIRAAKKNIEPQTDVSWLYDLNPVTFNYRKKTFNEETGVETYLEEAITETSYGLIAEEVETVKKDFCFYNKDEDNKDVLAGVSYKDFITPLIKALKDQKTKIETLETKVAALEAG